MEVILTILAVVGIVVAIWRKAASDQRHQDEIEQLRNTVAGQDAALKLKREQERLRNEEDAEADQKRAQEIRAARDKSAAIGFVRESFRDRTAPGPDSPEVPGPETPDEPGKPGKP